MGEIGLYILYQFHESRLHRPTAGFGAGRHRLECFFVTVQISTVRVAVTCLQNLTRDLNSAGGPILSIGKPHYDNVPGAS